MAGSHEDYTHLNLKLFPWEEVTQVVSHPLKIPSTPPNALDALALLTGASAGVPPEQGPLLPSVAARVTEGNSGIEDLRAFEVIFGRDSLIVAHFTRHMYPRLQRNTLVRLAELQGVTEDLWREEEVGKIVHEVRDPVHDKRAQELTKLWHWGWPYYGAVDATPLFVKSIHSYIHNSDEGETFLQTGYTGKDGQERTMGDALAAGVAWIRKRLSNNKEGFLEFKPPYEGSLENQVWKDRWDSYHHADGTIANHKKGIASIEVQALAYDALMDTADLYDVLKRKDDEARQLREEAHALREQVIKHMWVEDERGGYFALGTDRDDAGTSRTLKVRTSNMGHLLNSRMLDAVDDETVRKKDAVIKTLFSPEMLTASGIRTLSNKEIRFREGAYHNGSVWLWDTYYISEGLARHGKVVLAKQLNERISSVVEKYKKFPEFARGGDEDEPLLNERTIYLQDNKYNRVNRIEQPPQEIQAWTVAAMVAIEGTV